MMRSYSSSKESTTLSRSESFNGAAPEGCDLRPSISINRVSKEVPCRE